MRVLVFVLVLSVSIALGNAEFNSARFKMSASNEAPILSETHYGKHKENKAMGVPILSETHYGKHKKGKVTAASILSETHYTKPPKGEEQSFVQMF